MSAKSGRIRSNLRKVDAHRITAAEYEEIPEMTEAMLARAEYRVGGRLMPHPRHRGPQKQPTKVATSLRLSKEVLEHFKAQGPGWQTRIDEALQRLIAARKRTAAKS